MVHICRRGPPDGYEVEGRERTGDQETQPRLAGKDGSQGKGGRQNQTLIKPVVKVILYTPLEFDPAILCNGNYGNLIR